MRGPEVIDERRSRNSARPPHRALVAISLSNLVRIAQRARALRRRCRPRTSRPTSRPPAERAAFFRSPAGPVDVTSRTPSREQGGDLADLAPGRPTRGVWRGPARDALAWAAPLEPARARGPVEGSRPRALAAPPPGSRPSSSTSVRRASAVGLERLRLAARTVEREHQLSPEPLTRADALRATRASTRATTVLVTAERECRVHLLLGHTPRRSSSSLARSISSAGRHVPERWAAPQGGPLLQAGGRRPRHPPDRSRVLPSPDNCSKRERSSSSGPTPGRVAARIRGGWRSSPSARRRLET